MQRAKNLWYVYLPLLVAFLSLSAFIQRDSNEKVRGNGEVKEENRQAQRFRNIGSSGAFKVYITQGNTHSIKVEAESNLLPYIITEIDGDDLEIKVKKGYDIRPTRQVNVYVTMQDIHSLACSGSGGFYSKGALKTDELELAISGVAEADLDVNASDVKVSVSGAGNIKLRGSAASAKYSVSGRADIAAFDLQTDDVRVGISGNASANVNAQKNLDIGVSGMGTIKYKGNPSIKQAVSGMGKVSKEG